LRLFKGFGLFLKEQLGFFAIFELLIVGNKLYFNQIAEFGGNSLKFILFTYCI